MSKVLFTCKDCSFTIEERVSKNGKAYKAMILKVNGKEYMIFQNSSTENTFNNIRLDNPQK